MNSYFPTNPDQPHRLPTPLDLGDWTTWSGVSIERADHQVVADVQYQVRYSLNAAGDVGFALMPTKVDQVAVDFRSMPVVEEGRWCVILVDGKTCRIPGL